MRGFKAPILPQKYDTVFQEDAEDSLYNIARNKGYTVYEDYCWFSTEEGTNDGYGSYVNVP